MFDSAVLTTNSNVRLGPWQEQPGFSSRSFTVSSAAAARMFLITCIITLTPDTRRWVWPPFRHVFVMQPVCFDLRVQRIYHFVSHFPLTVPVALQNLEFFSCYMIKSQITWIIHNTGPSLLTLTWRQLLGESTSEDGQRCKDGVWTDKDTHRILNYMLLHNFLPGYVMVLVVLS